MVESTEAILWIAPERAARTRVDRALAEAFPDTTRATFQRWIAEGRVEVDGVRCRARDLLRAGVTVRFWPLAPPLSQALPESDIEFQVRYEDEDLIVVDKPAGLVVHPARGHATGTLVNGLLGRGGFRAAPTDPDDEEGHLRPGIVHRLDRETSGLLVVAKTERAREGLKGQFAAHTIERRYLALVYGAPTSQRIESLHGRDPHNRLKFTSQASDGKHAVTNVRLLERFGGGRASLVECRLETGRTHQIRVHLTERTRTPLLADDLYRDPSVQTDIDVRPIAEALGRQALHATSLGFVHPSTGEELSFESELPEDMQTALERLRGLVALRR